jgi:hypothetical protein
VATPPTRLIIVPESRDAYMDMEDAAAGPAFGNCWLDKELLRE